MREQKCVRFRWSRSSVISAVTHSVISTGAVDGDSGIMDFDLEEAEFARMVLTRGRRRIAVTDHSKFGRQGLVKVCDFSALTEIVTDHAPPEDIMRALEATSVGVVLAMPNA